MFNSIKLNYSIKNSIKTLIHFSLSFISLKSLWKHQRHFIYCICTHIHIRICIIKKKKEKFVCIWFWFSKDIKKIQWAVFFLMDSVHTQAIGLRAMHLYSMRGQRALNVKWMRVLERDEEKRHSRVTIEITSRVIVVAAHNSSGNSGNGGGTYAVSCCWYTRDF